MPDGQIAGATISERVFGRLPATVVDGLRPDQRAAIAEALAAEISDRPPVNIRVSIPLLFERWYLTVFAGKERRGRERLKRDRITYPLRTAGNVLFIAAGVAVFYTLGVIGYLLYSSVLEF